MRDENTKLRFKLQQFTGEMERFRHSLNRRVIYTPGIHYLADKGGAYWLIDAISFYYGSPIMKQAIAEDPRLEYMQFWRLRVREDHSARLSMNADKGEKLAIVQEISFTDFPLNHIDIWAGYDGNHWTLYLPSEH